MLHGLLLALRIHSFDWHTWRRGWQMSRSRRRDRSEASTAAGRFFLDALRFCVILHDKLTSVAHSQASLPLHSYLGFGLRGRRGLGGLIGETANIEPLGCHCR